MIKGTADTAASPLGIPKAGTTITVRMDPSDPTAQKIGLMLAYKFAEHGWKLANSEPELVAEFRYGIGNAGSTSVATTTPGRTSATLIGDTAYIRSTPSTTVIENSQSFTKFLNVTVRKSVDGAVVWSGKVAETGSCNKFIVTAPQIVTLLFDGFPADQTNRIKTLSSNSEQVKSLQKLFPPETSWTTC